MKRETSSRLLLLRNNVRKKPENPINLVDGRSSVQTTDTRPRQAPLIPVIAIVVHQDRSVIIKNVATAVAAAN